MSNNWAMGISRVNMSRDEIEKGHLMELGKAIKCGTQEVKWEKYIKEEGTSNYVKDPW